MSDLAVDYRLKAPCKSGVVVSAVFLRLPVIRSEFELPLLIR